MRGPTAKGETDGFQNPGWLPETQKHILQLHCLLQLQGKGRDTTTAGKRRKETGPERGGSFILHGHPNFPGSRRSRSFPASPGAARETTPCACHGRSHKYPYQDLWAPAVKAFTSPCFGKQRGKAQRPSRRSAGQPQACPHDIPGAGQHQARTLSPSDSTSCPALPPETLREDAVKPGLSIPEEDLDTRTRTQISGQFPQHLSSPHGSHPSPTPNTTLFVDKSLQAHLAEPCLCLAHHGEDTSSPPPSFPGQEEALHGGSSLSPMIQKQKLEGKDKSACHRIKRHKVFECTRLC